MAKYDYRNDLINRARKQLTWGRRGFIMMPIVGGIACYMGLDCPLIFISMWIGIVQYFRFDLTEDLLKELEDKNNTTINNISI